jgi:hypothetical protein
MTQSSGSPKFELLRWERPEGVSPVGLPKRHEFYRSVGHVYVFELSNGTIKVGRTANPWQRMEQHLKQAAPFELRVVRLWLSVPHLDAAEVERHLLGYARQNAAGQVLDEYFTGLDFDSIARFAASVPFKPADDAALAELARLEREAHEASPFVQAMRAARQREQAEAAAAVKPPRTPAASLIAGVLGENPDGSIRLPETLDTDVSILAPLIDRIAQLRSVSGQTEISGPNWMDMVETLVVGMVTTEFNILRQRMYQENLKHLWAPLGDLAEECEPWSGLRCDDCGSEVLVSEEGRICSGCGQEEPEPEDEARSVGVGER